MAWVLPCLRSIRPKRCMYSLSLALPPKIIAILALGISIPSFNTLVVTIVL